jgi:hypothetical protein
MVKFILGGHCQNGSSLFLISLCAKLTEKGFDCCLYSAERWSHNIFPSKGLEEFRLERGDTLIFSEVYFYSLKDFSNLTLAINANKRNRILRFFFSLIQQVLITRHRLFHADHKLIYSCSKPNLVDLLHGIFLYNKIHSRCSADLAARCKIKKIFYLPPFTSDLCQSRTKPQNIAGVIGSIKQENKISLSIQRALSDGMEKVIVFGSMEDPRYFYQEIIPLAEKHGGRVKYAGFLNNKQSMYDSFSHIYRSAEEPWSPVFYEAKLTGTHYRGPDVCQHTSLNEEQICSMWINILELNRPKN